MTQTSVVRNERQQVLPDLHQRPGLRVSLGHDAGVRREQRCVAELQPRVVDRRLRRGEARVGAAERGAGGRDLAAGGGGLPPRRLEIGRRGVARGSAAASSCCAEMILDAASSAIALVVGAGLAVVRFGRGDRQPVPTPPRHAWPGAVPRAWPAALREPTGRLRVPKVRLGLLHAG